MSSSPIVNSAQPKPHGFTKATLSKYPQLAALTDRDSQRHCLKQAISIARRALGYQGSDEALLIVLINAFNEAIRLHATGLIDADSNPTFDTIKKVVDMLDDLSHKGTITYDAAPSDSRSRQPTAYAAVLRAAVDRLTSADAADLVPGMEYLEAQCKVSRNFKHGLDVIAANLKRSKSSIAAKVLADITAAKDAERKRMEDLRKPKARASGSATKRVRGDLELSDFDDDKSRSGSDDDGSDREDSEREYEVEAGAEKRRKSSSGVHVTIGKRH